MRKLVCVLLITLTFAQATVWGQCHVRKRCAPVCAAPVVVAPPVVVHQDYVAPVLTAFVPIAVPTYSVTYAPGEPYASEILQLRQQLQALQGGAPAQAGVGQGAPSAIVPPDPRQMPGADVPKPAPEPKRDAALGATADSKAVALLTNRCAQCHTGNASKGNMVIFDAPGRLSATFNRAKVIKAVYSEKMPPASAGSKMSDEDVAVLIDGLGT